MTKPLFMEEMSIGEYLDSVQSFHGGEILILVDALKAVVGLHCEKKKAKMICAECNKPLPCPTLKLAADMVTASMDSLSLKVVWRTA